MRVPHTISKNVIEAYRCSGQTLLLEPENRSIRAENETWDESLVSDLKTLALRALLKLWPHMPVLEELPSPVDRDALLELLPADLPFEIIIQKIPYEYYWSRAAKARWEHNNPNEHGNSWRRLYCERHLTEYLESLENVESEKEECEALINLVQPYVSTLTIRSLQPSKYPFKWSGDDDEDQCTAADFPVHHIPMDVIVPKLTELRELRLNFGMIYMNEGFEWRDFEFSVEDCLNLGKGIKNAKKMEKIRITRSNLDQPRAAALLQGIVVNNNIQVLDLSHCKLEDTGAHAIGEFLKMHRRLKELYLINNDIRADGVSGIVHGLLQESSTPLRHLDLRLNPLRDDGGTHIAALILRVKHLEILNVSGCCLKTETGMALAEVIASGYTKISSLQIDISNNNMGPIAGEALDIAVKSCPQIIGLDVRMCNFSKESEYLINESVQRNNEELTKKRMRSVLESKRSISFIPLRAKSLLPPPGFEDLQRPQYDVPSDDELRNSFYAEFGDGSSFGGEQAEAVMDQSNVSDADVE
ncbi:T-complex-associated testis-expressed protein 1 [Fopius arisanus]|uniref:T-complex-associated testis-expressed protein 1 n=2 Tax=Fopius arisanus TaxID=64838 RepID=A0A9R1TQD7_9HYME|nr:PREDICTED: T-complex-associated testis-expressed protein 1 [Fopius arisanus]